MKKATYSAVFTISLFVSFLGCNAKKSSHQEMIEILRNLNGEYNRYDNYYASSAQVRYYDSLINSAEYEQDKMRYTYNLSRSLITLGREDKAIEILEKYVEKIESEGIMGMDKLKTQLALAYLRSGERTNCIKNHNSETCILPIVGGGIHKLQSGSRKAVKLYGKLLKEDPDNMEFRWLLNIGYMTLGLYPDSVPSKYLLPHLNVQLTANSLNVVQPFKDIANPLGLDINNMAGGSIIDDFDNDGYLDIITSSWALDEPMHYFKNDGKGNFIDITTQSGLSDLTGGLNLMQMDFNNDGFKDVFVLRGAWLREKYGLQPNSLIKNNGDGTFTDVTTVSGLLSFHPTQTATWNDFNNDGWIDVFIGNETWEGNKASGEHPCELYLNNQDGTFSNISKESGTDIIGFVKGVTSGDYNNDGWKDIFIATLSGERYLLKNKGRNNQIVVFENVTKEAGLADGAAKTFPSWFWDYDNDGWLDILTGDFTFDRPISSYSAEQALGKYDGTSGAVKLYQNNKDGTFSDVSKEVGLTKTAFAMGANFGDIDNDGFLDFYLGTGNPEIESIVPNKLFKNIKGERFLDVTVTARVGNLQKGHAISFADIDNDGDQDIYIEMGGAFKGDTFHNALYSNSNNLNNWVTLELVGNKSNKAAIGSRISITIIENGVKRMIFRDVNSGGSFGASPMRREIGLGKAAQIEKIEVNWHGGGEIQTFENVKVNHFYRIKEGSSTLEEVNLNTLSLEKTNHDHHHH